MATERTSTPPPAPLDSNRDPISGKPGSHPVGTSIGAATGGATGAAIGIGAGPVGVVVGTVVGALVGAYAGRGVAEGIDPTQEDAYWRERHSTQPYANAKRSFEDYAAAYRAGYVNFHKNKTFEEREAELRKHYEEEVQKAEEEAESLAKSSTGQTSSRLTWDEARHAARAAYERLEREQVRKPGDPDPLPPHPGQIG